MSLRLRMVALALPAALLVACQDQPTSPAAQGPAATAVSRPLAADYTNNILGGGPFLVRFDFEASGGGFGNDNVYASYSTIPQSWMYGAENWDDAVCGPPNVGGTGNFQVIMHWDTTWSDPTALYKWHGTNEQWITLLDLTASGPCFGFAPIATGWGRVQWFTNNGNWSPDYNNIVTNARAEGALTTPSGDKVQFSGHNQCQYNGHAWHCQTKITY